MNIRDVFDFDDDLSYDDHDVMSSDLAMTRTMAGSSVAEESKANSDRSPVMMVTWCVVESQVKAVASLLAMSSPTCHVVPA